MRGRAAVTVAVAIWLGSAGAGCATAPGRRGDRGGALLGEGLASFYGPGLYGRRTASGERLEPTSRIAAHRTLSFGTCLTVEVPETGRSTRVRVADRGPFVAGRVLDVSEAAARDLGMLQRGVMRVRFWRC